jgi:hypothetical protein
MFRRNDTRRVQILGTNAIVRIQIIARRLEDAQAHQYDAFQRHDSERHAAAVAVAEDALSALASLPALSVAEILAKAKALGPVQAATLASLSEGESALAASIIRDVRRMAEFSAGASDT